MLPPPFCLVTYQVHDRTSTSAKPTSRGFTFRSSTLYHRPLRTLAYRNSGRAPFANLLHNFETFGVTFVMRLRTSAENDSLMRPMQIALIGSTPSGRTFAREKQSGHEMDINILHMYSGVIFHSGITMAWPCFFVGPGLYVGAVTAPNLCLETLADLRQEAALAEAFSRGELIHVPVCVLWVHIALRSSYRKSPCLHSPTCHCNSIGV